jgi:hypothetical protein
VSPFVEFLLVFIHWKNKDFDSAIDVFSKWNYSYHKMAYEQSIQYPSLPCGFKTAGALLDQEVFDKLEILRYMDTTPNRPFVLFAKLQADMGGMAALTDLQKMILEVHGVGSFDKEVFEWFQTTLIQLAMTTGALASLEIYHKNPTLAQHAVDQLESLLNSSRVYLPDDMSGQVRKLLIGSYLTLCQLDKAHLDLACKSELSTTIKADICLSTARSNIDLTKKVSYFVRAVGFIHAPTEQLTTVPLEAPLTNTAVNTIWWR